MPARAAATAARKEFGSRIATPASRPIDRRPRAERDHLVDVADHPEERRHALPRRDDDRRLRRSAAHIGNRGQSHDGVAQPVGREDEDAVHGSDVFKAVSAK